MLGIMKRNFKNFIMLYNAQASAFHHIREAACPFLDLPYSGHTLSAMVYWQSMGFVTRRL